MSDRDSTRARLQSNLVALAEVAAALDAHSRRGERLDDLADLFAGSLEDYPALDAEPTANWLVGWCDGVACALDMTVLELIDAYAIDAAALTVQVAE